MFIALVHVHVKPDRVDDFKEMIRANHEGSVAEPGCLRFDVAHSKDDPTRFVLWEWYVDEAANQAHKATPHYLTFRAAMGDMMAEERVSVLYTGIFPETRLGRLMTVGPGNGRHGPAIHHRAPAPHHVRIGQLLP